MPPAPGPAGVEVVTLDVRAPAAAWKPVLDGVRAVVHTAGLRAERPWRGETFAAVHVEGTARLLTAARAAGVERVVLLSCLGAGSGGHGALLHSKAAAEALVRESGLEWTILRCGLVYGPGDGRIMRLARWMAWLGRAPVLGEGDLAVQPLAVGDVVTGVVRAATGAGLGRRLLLAAGPDVLSFRDMVELLAAALDRRLPLWRVPVGLARRLAAVAALGGPLPWTGDELEVLLQGHTCDPREYFHAVGIARPLPFSAAVRAYLGP